MIFPQIGAWFEGTTQHYRVWAPDRKKVDLVFMSDDKVELQSFSMKPEARGYFILSINSAPSDLYKFRLDEDVCIPDPASRFQPYGPHGPSQIVSSEFRWTDKGWKGVALNELVIYELHVGTFTDAGQFLSIKEHIGRLKEIGINAIELMPIAQFAGARNWGYDGVGVFAAQNTYGDKNSAVELKELIDYCHSQGMAVILDVVYNHLGPEGNYLSLLGPYFTDRYKNPWGNALNFDGPYCDEVRNYFLQNAKQWIQEFHFDGLRLDAVHSILDPSAKSFLEQLAELGHEVSKKQDRIIHLIAENDTNDSRLVKSIEEGGTGLTAHWADDFHHVVHTLLTGETEGYYADFGKPSQLKDVFERGIVYDGRYSAVHHRSRGRSYKGTDRSKLIYCTQNHDQIGNRKDGDRLISLIGPEGQKIASSLLFLSGGTPLIFMGEEVAGTEPFLYFVDHTDPKLLEAVRNGRKKEFEGFGWKEEPPDPGSIETFKRSKISWKTHLASRQGQEFTHLYKRLISLSKWIRKEGFYNRGVVVENLEADLLRIKTGSGKQEIELYISLKEVPSKIQLAQNRELLFDSNAPDFIRQIPSDSLLEIAPRSVVLMKGSL